MTKLVMHYAPGGILAILKREPCPGQRATGFINGKRVHNSCACDTSHQIHRIVNVTVLQDDEQGWCLERSWINRELAHQERA